MKKILKYSFIGLAALCTALLCGGYYMLGHALNPDELITRSRNSQASYEYMFGQYPELKPWVDSLQTAGALRDFYIKNDRGETLHALYEPLPNPPVKRPSLCTAIPTTPSACSTSATCTTGN